MHKTTDSNTRTEKNVMNTTNETEPFRLESENIPTPAPVIGDAWIDDSDERAYIREHAASAAPERVAGVAAQLMLFGGADDLFSWTPPANAPTLARMEEEATRAPMPGDVYAAEIGQERAAWTFFRLIDYRPDDEECTIAILPKIYDDERNARPDFAADAGAPTTRRLILDDERGPGIRMHNGRFCALDATMRYDANERYDEAIDFA